MSGHTYDSLSLGGAFTPSGQPFTGPTAVINDQITDDETTYLAGGSYTISGGVVSISATAFTSTQSQNQWYTYSAGGDDALTIGGDASFNTGQFDSQTFYESDSGNFSSINDSRTVTGSEFQTATQTYTLATTYDGSALDGSSLTQQQIQSFTATFWNTASQYNSPSTTSSSGTAVADQHFGTSSTYSTTHTNNEGSDTFIDWGSASGNTSFHDSGTYLLTSGSAGSTDSETGGQTYDNWLLSNDFDRRSGSYDSSEGDGALVGEYDESQGVYLSASQHQSGYYVDSVTTGLFTDDNITEQSGTYSDSGRDTSFEDRDASYNQFDGLGTSLGYHDSGSYSNVAGSLSQSGDFYSDESNDATAIYVDDVDYSSDTFAGESFEDNTDTFNSTLHASGTFTSVDNSYSDSATFTQTQTAIGTESFHDEGTYTDDSGGSYSSNESSSANEWYSASGWYTDDDSGHNDSATYISSSTENDTGDDSDTQGYVNDVAEGTTTFVADDAFNSSYGHTGWYTDSPDDSSLSYTYVITEDGFDDTADVDQGTYVGDYDGRFDNSDSLFASMSYNELGTVTGVGGETSNHGVYTFDQQDFESTTQSTSFTETGESGTVTVAESTSLSFSSTQDTSATEDTGPNGSYQAIGTNDYNEWNDEWDEYSENGNSTYNGYTTETFTYQDEITTTASGSYASSGSFTQRGFVASGDTQITSDVEDGTFDDWNSTSYHDSASDTDSVTLYNSDTLITTNSDESDSITTNYEYSAGYHDDNEGRQRQRKYQWPLRQPRKLQRHQYVHVRLQLQHSYEDTGTSSFSESYSTSITDDATGGTFTSATRTTTGRARATRSTERRRAPKRSTRSASGSGFTDFNYGAGQRVLLRRLWIRLLRLLWLVRAVWLFWQRWLLLPVVRLVRWWRIKRRTSITTA